ncbi:MAG: FAD-dependent oxidoreductase, partial [Pseudomonadota bacterium]
MLGEQDGPPDNGAHAARLKGRPNDFPSPALGRMHGERMRKVASRFVPALADARIQEAYIGWRPLPLDGHPVIGPSPARPPVYLAIMHSGVTLAPVVGRLVAQELAAG